MAVDGAAVVETQLLEQRARHEHALGMLLETPRQFEQRRRVLQHRLGAAQALLGGLEDEVHRTVEAPRAGELLRCAEQHRRVAVMAAAVVHAGTAAGMRQA